MAILIDQIWSLASPASMENVVESGAPWGEPEVTIPDAPVAAEIVSFAIAELKNHRLSNAIYGAEIGEDLVESIRTLGVLQPILVTRDSLEIISGNSRVQAARQLGYEVIQGTYFASDNDLEIQQAVLESNSQRVKTNEQKIREYNARKTIESELALQRRVADDPKAKPTKAFTKEVKGKARDHAAKKVGVSANVADRAIKVIEEADRLKEEGKVDESTELINALNKSIKTAHKMVTRKDEPAEGEPSQPKAEPLVSLSAVTGMPYESQQEAIEAARRVVRFLQTRDTSDFTFGQSEEWSQIAGESSGRLRELRVL